MSPGSIERQVYRSFWNKFSNRADNTSMLLNANADELAELDKTEIMGLLPNYEGKFVVDIGAGIGRFTSEFAKMASKVVSIDFMENFIVKNRERNGHFGNVEFRVGDAVGLEFEEGSVDLVFTNWLLMYLSDEEAIRFLGNVLKWLRPGNGKLHLRESCSESSTPGKKAGTASSSLHSENEVNPTKYHFSSAYINLMNKIRHKDDQGDVWKFKIHWACSVGVYIEKNGNWRQVHWLVTKMPVENDFEQKIPFEIELAKNFTEKWPKEQKKWDVKLDEVIGRNKMFASKILTMNNVDWKIDGENSTIFVYNNRQNAAQFGIDPHILAEHFGCRIWCIELNQYCYRHSLTKANEAGDRRIRIGWHLGMEEALEFWRENGGQQFNAFLGTNLLLIGNAVQIDNIAAILQNEGILMSLEAEKVDEKKIQILENNFQIMSMNSIKMEEGIEMEFILAKKKMAKGNYPNGEWATMPMNGGF